LTDRRAALLPLDETLMHTYDPYAFVRDAYLQRPPTWYPTAK